MHITLVGISHKTAPVKVRERFVFSGEELPDALPRFGGAAVLLSTCNRTEVYLTAHHTITPGSVIALLGELKGQEDVAPDAFYHLAGEDAVRHLFRVAAGIESMVLGESEILGQVRTAFDAAIDANTHNAVLSRLFRAAIRVGRQARSRTDIGRHAVSVSSMAVALARRTLQDLSERTVLVVSAGEAGMLAARNLKETGASRLLVTSRTEERARDLARDLGGETVPFESLGRAMADADVVISSSAAPDFLIGADDVRRATANRNGRELLLIDIAVPRDVDPAVRGLPRVHLYDIDDLQAEVEQNLEARLQEVTKAEEILEEELSRFSDWLGSRGVVPTIASLSARADALRKVEVERLLKRGAGFNQVQRARVDAMANALVKKLLHDPISRMKGEDGERYAAAIRDLFRLDGDAGQDEPPSPATPSENHRAEG